VIGHRGIYTIQVDLIEDKVANVVHLFTAQVTPKRVGIRIMPSKLTPALQRRTRRKRSRLKRAVPQ
jgi:hypothetical protein